MSHLKKILTVSILFALIALCSGCGHGRVSGHYNFGSGGVWFQLKGGPADTACSELLALNP